MQIRTDLAQEAHEIALGAGELPGVKTSRRRFGALWADVAEVTDENGSRALGKPVGTYVTLDVGRLWQDGVEEFRGKVLALRDALRFILPDVPGPVLVAGLGNRLVTADAVGPLAVDSLIVTRHVKKERPGLFGSLGLSEVCALCPGVLGQTGIESADVLKNLCLSLSPAFVVAVDALAARRVKRLATTVQLSDSGISPGSGVGNARAPLDRETLGCEVICIGVPTVVDAATLALDCLGETLADSERLAPLIEHAGLNFFVTPKETDSIMKSMGTLIGGALNLALNPKLDYDTMLSLAAC
ncbi:MAG: GPR endopeptidase [Clostridia bacterium]|nr:GPR endopeptidase [Clostridia bacterium]